MPISAAKNMLASAIQAQSAPNCRNASPAADSASSTAPLRISVALWNTAVWDSCNPARQRRSRAAAATSGGATMTMAMAWAPVSDTDACWNSTRSAQSMMSKHARPPSSTQGSATCHR